VLPPGEIEVTAGFAFPGNPRGQAAVQVRRAEFQVPTAGSHADARVLTNIGEHTLILTTP